MKLRTILLMYCLILMAGVLGFHQLIRYRIRSEIRPQLLETERSINETYQRLDDIELKIEAAEIKLGLRDPYMRFD